MKFALVHLDQPLTCLFFCSLSFSFVFVSFSFNFFFWGGGLKRASHIEQNYRNNNYYVNQVDLPPLVLRNLKYLNNFVGTERITLPNIFLPFEGSTSHP